MKTAKAQMFFGKDMTGHRERRAVGGGKTELRIGRRRLHKGVRVRLHPGIDADENVLHHPALLRFQIERVRFGIGVDDDPADLRIERFPALIGKFIVAVEIDLFRRESHRKRRIELPARNDVDADALLFCDLIHRLAGKRLRGVQDEPVAVVLFVDGVAVERHHLADIRLVKDIERRLELLCKFRAVGAADLEVPRRVDLQSISRIHMRSFLRI